MSYAKSVLAMFALGVTLVAGVFALYVTISLLAAWPFMWLWNASVAVAFGLQPIAYWTSFWLLVLISFFAAPRSVSVNKES